MENGEEGEREEVRLLFATNSFMNFIVSHLIKGLALRTFFGLMVAYLVVALNKQVQETMNYYKMFSMNAWGDAHAMRNKGRLMPIPLNNALGCLPSLYPLWYYRAWQPLCPQGGTRWGGKIVGVCEGMKPGTSSSSPFA